MCVRNFITLVLSLITTAPSLAHDLWVETNVASVSKDEPIEVAFKLGNCNRGQLTFRTSGLLDKSGTSFFEEMPNGKRRLISQELTRSSDDTGGYWHTVKEMKDPGFTWFCQTLDQAIEHDGMRMRGILSAKAIVFTQQNQSSAEPGQDKALGFPLELVLLSSPFPSVDDSKSIQVQLLLNRKPISNVAVSYLRQAFDPKLTQVSDCQCITDGNGKADFNANRPGLYLISARHIVNDDGSSPIYYSTSLTLRVSRHETKGHPM